MKTLILPQKTANQIDLSEITNKFEGIIIGYNKDLPTGYIIHGDEWYYCDSLQFDMFEIYDDVLVNVIHELMDSNICDSFKVIEFKK